MKRHLTTSTASTSTQNAGGGGIASVIRAHRTSTTVDRNTHTQPVREGLSPTFENRSVWGHTLVLTGELTYRSALVLELAIERLCEEGVTDITLDLRQLADIDSIGVAVISFRCGLCRRQGYGFELIPGSRSIHRAFERAGVIDLLQFQGDEVAARRLRASIPVQRSRDGCEQ